jgi:hypothetical protein
MKKTCVNVLVFLGGFTDTSTRFELQVGAWKSAFVALMKCGIHMKFSKIEDSLANPKSKDSLHPSPMESST